MGKHQIRWGKKYFEWQAAVFKKDDYTCAHCGEKEKRLNAHHIIPYENEETRHDVNNGLTLCTSCHSRVHNKGKKAWNKGIKVSEEMRKKYSVAHLGQVAWNKGKKTSPEVIEKIRLARTGKKIKPFTEERKKAASERMKEKWKTVDYRNNRPKRYNKEF
jgi:DNA-directed RNA polymerase subunit RPC12/RpoP